MQCVSDCQHPWWGGDGMPTTQDDGECTCSCGQGFTSFNSFGESACEPKPLHALISAVALLVSVLTTAYGAWNLCRQEKHVFCRRRTKADVGKLCRKLYKAAVVQGLVHALYFAGFTIFQGFRNGAVYVRWWTIALVFTCVASTVPAMLSLELWLTTHDKRLVRDAAFINFLATALGTANHMVQIVTGIGMAVQSVAVAVLVLSGLPTAAKIFGVIGASCGAGLVLGTTLCCCLSLLRIISKRQQGPAVGTSSGTDLARARKKIKKDAWFILITAFSVTLNSTVVCATRVGLATPAIFFLAPMTILPLVWTLFNMRVHSTRTRPWNVSKMESKAVVPSDISSAALPRTLQRPLSCGQGLDNSLTANNLATTTSSGPAGKVTYREPVINQAGMPPKLTVSLPLPRRAQMYTVEEKKAEPTDANVRVQRDRIRSTSPLPPNKRNHRASNGSVSNKWFSSMARATVAACEGNPAAIVKPSLPEVGPKGSQNHSSGG